MEQRRAANGSWCPPILNLPRLGGENTLLFAHGEILNWQLYFPIAFPLVTLRPGCYSQLFVNYESISILGLLIVQVNTLTYPHPKEKEGHLLIGIWYRRRFQVNPDLARLGSSTLVRKSSDALILPSLFYSNACFTVIVSFSSTSFISVSFRSFPDLQRIKKRKCQWVKNSQSCQWVQPGLFNSPFCG